MKLTKTLLTLAGGLLLASCSSDPVDSKEVTFEGEKTTATVSVLVDENATRAVTFPDNKSLATEERIYNALAVAFDNRGLLEAFADFDQFQQGGVNPSSITLTFNNITVGTHEFYVIANAPRTLLERKEQVFPKGMTVVDFRAEMLQLAEVADIIREKTTFTQSDMNLTTRGFLMTSDQGYTRVLAAESTNDFTVKLVRAVAKVSVAYDPADNGEQFGKLEDVKYRVVNNPNMMYIFPNVFGTLVYTPYFNDAYSSNNYMGSAHGYKDAITASTADADKTYTYCVENSNLAALQGNSTMVYIKAKFVPDVVVNSSQQTNNPTPDGTFWMLKESSTGMPDGYYYAEYPTNVPNGWEVVEYPQGICYYNKWLKNSVADRYMVKRNTYVKLSITAVYGPGEPDEGDGVEPELPIDETTTAVITVEVLDWEGDDQDIQL